MSEKPPILLLEQFNIPFPETPDSYNLIGLRYSDDELSGASVQWDCIRRGFVIKNLSLDESGIPKETPNIYYISPALGRLVPGIRETEVMNDVAGGRYQNFIRCIGTEEAETNYILANGTVSDMTYSDVMAESFNIAVNTIFKSDSARLLDPEKPTIILVGCPSGAGWEKTKLEYAGLLRSRLSLPDNITGPVYVAIQKESDVIAACELSSIQREKEAERQEVIVILDNGSGTFGITVAGEHGIPENGEDSYRFGGNLIDENLLKLMQNQINKEYPGLKLSSPHGHELGLRSARELYYGIDENLRVPPVYPVSLAGKTDAKGRNCRLCFEINDDVMKDALYRIPVSACHMTESEDFRIKKQMVSCDSWMDGCRKIYQAFYDEMKLFFTVPGDAEHPVVPHRLILRGDVSAIPEVRKLAGEVFGVEPIWTNHPNYSIAEGLACILGFETKKALFFRELISEIPGKLPDVYSLREAVIRAGVAEIWRSIKISLEKWSEYSYSLFSIKDWSERFLAEEIPHNLTRSVQRGVRRWYEDEGVENIIEGFLQKKFSKCFSGYEYIPNPLSGVDFSTLTGGTTGITIDYAFFFGKLTSGEELNTILSEAGLNVKRNQPWREKAYRNILQMEDKIQKGGGNVYSYTYMRNRIFSGPVEDTRNIAMTYDGLDAMLRKKITDSDVQEIRAKVLSLLEKPLKEYVESIPGGVVK